MKPIRPDLTYKGVIILEDKSQLEKKIDILRRDRESWYSGDQVDSFADRYRYEAEKRKELYYQIMKNISCCNKKLLDVGCGDGFWINKLHKRFPDLKYHGIDYNITRLIRNKKRNPFTKLYLGDITRSDLFGKESFDIIFSSHCLEHVKDDQKVLDNIYFWLKPDGVFVLQVPQEGVTLFKIRDRILQRNILKTTDHVHFYTCMELKKKILGAGFRIT
ncbi:MAG: class I SAM-dependent methyltransferase, partial [archaeon]